MTRGAGGPTATTSHPPIEPELLERVAEALRAPLELRDVLRVIGELALEATDADHASLFLLDGHELHPAVGVCRERDEDLSRVFTRLGAVWVDPVRWDLFRSSSVVAIDDARTSPLIPASWVARFPVQCVAMGALWSGGEACGLLAVDRVEARAFAPTALERLGTLAQYASMAVAQARPFESVRRRARLQEGVARGAAALASPLEPEEVVARLAEAFAELLGATSCAVAVLDETLSEITTLGTVNTRELRPPIPLAAIPERILAPLREAWDVARHPHHPLEVEPDRWLVEFLGGGEPTVAWHLLVPLVVHGETRGAALLGFSSRARLDAEERAAAEALAALGAAALERHRLLDRLSRQLRRLHVLYQASAALTEGAGGAALVAALNLLLGDQGIEIIGVAFRDRGLAAVAGADEPLPEERRGWRRGNAPVALPGGGLAVPMRLGSHIAGSVRVRATKLDAEDQAFLEALAAGLAEVVKRSALRAAVEEAARERAVAAERERFAADLHDTAGQLFVTLALLTRRLLEQVPYDSFPVASLQRIAELAGEGKQEIDKAIRALAFVPGARRGLLCSLHSLAQAVAEDSGLEVSLDITGRPARLSPELEQALYRVAHEALTNAWRHARCSAIRMEVGFEPGEVVLRVCDDGDGPGPTAPGTGMASMQRAVVEVGGRLEVRDAEPHGTVVEARVTGEPR